MKSSASTSTRRCRRTRREINEGGTAGAGGPSLVCRGLRLAADSGTPFFCKGMCGCQRRDGGIIAILPLMAHSVMRAWLKMQSWGNRRFFMLLDTSCYGIEDTVWTGRECGCMRSLLTATRMRRIRMPGGGLPPLPGRDPGRHLVWPGLHPLLLRREPHAGAALRRATLVPGGLEAKARRHGAAAQRPGHGGHPLSGPALVRTVSPKRIRGCQKGWRHSRHPFC